VRPPRPHKCEAFFIAGIRSDGRPLSRDHACGLNADALSGSTRDLTQYALMPPDGPPSSESAFELPQRLVELALALSNGPKPGSYDIEVRDSGGRPLATVSGRATPRSQNASISCRSPRDMTAWPVSPCISTIGEGWRLFPSSP
jgi:hypothetical protein